MSYPQPRGSLTDSLPAMKRARSTVFGCDDASETDAGDTSNAPAAPLLASASSNATADAPATPFLDSASGKATADAFAAPFIASASSNATADAAEAPAAPFTASSTSGSTAAADAPAGPFIASDSGSETATTTGGMLPGPRTITEAFQWHHDVLRSVVSSEERKGTLLKNLQKPWCVSSDYSGMRTEETACAALQSAVMSALQVNFNPKFQSWCDNDGYCSAVMLGSDDSRKPEHAFMSLNSYLKPDVQTLLDNMEAQAPAPHPNADRQAKQNANTKRMRMYDLMGQYLLSKAASEFVDTSAFCCLHFQQCPITTGACEILVAGLTCVAFSSMGKMEGLAHPSSRDLLTFAVGARHRRPIFLVLESAASYPKEKISELLEDLYHLEFISHPGPVLHGWPISRPRMYCMGFLRDKVTFTGSAEEYLSLCTRSVSMTADDFFFLPADEQDCLREFCELCRKRCMQFSERAAAEPWNQHYSAFQQTVLREYETLAEEAKQKAQESKQRNDADAAASQAPFAHATHADMVALAKQDALASGVFVADLDHHSMYGMSGSHIPCLIRHGTLFSMRKKRHMCLTELMACQGFPVCPLLEADYRPGFASMVQATVREDPRCMSATQWRKMLGNGMFVPALASIMLYGLSCMADVPAKMLRMTSVSSFVTGRSSQELEDDDDDSQNQGQSLMFQGDELAGLGHSACEHASSSSSLAQPEERRATAKSKARPKILRVARASKSEVLF